MLEVKNLSIIYGPTKAVDNASFSVGKNEIVGIVGESGSGKSTIALSIMRLIYPPGRISSGEIIFNGRDLLKLAEKEMINIRGAKISMIFQDPFTSLNPVFKIGDQIAEVISLHQGLNGKEAWEKAVEMLGTVKIRDAVGRAHDYPHQFSGGMLQRVMIAMALACKPEILIADEPTTALDVSIQSEILALLDELKIKYGFSIIYITHNFGIIKQICDRVIVMNKGKIVEEGKTGEVFSNPKELYTKKLIDCLKVLNKV